MAYHTTISVLLMLSLNCNLLFVFLGETDWKVIAIDVTDPLADKLNGM